MAASSQKFSQKRVIYFSSGCQAIAGGGACVGSPGAARRSVSARIRGSEPATVVLRSFVDLLPTGTAVESRFGRVRTSLKTTLRRTVGTTSPFLLHTVPYTAIPIQDSRRDRSSEKSCLVEGIPFVPTRTFFIRGKGIMESFTFFPNVMSRGEQDPL